MELIVPRAADFDPDGSGSARQWESIDWQPMPQVGRDLSPHATRFKALYSDSAIYFLVEAADSRLSCAKTRDFDDIFTEDVVEVFLWPDERQELYLEYEISPLGTELVLAVPNHRGVFMGWRPWHYEGERRVRKAVSVRGGPQEPMAQVEGWTAEFAIPFALFTGFGNAPPAPGTKWRADVFRIDCDTPGEHKWAWCPDTGGEFHDFRRFGCFVFG